MSKAEKNAETTTTTETVAGQASVLDQILDKMPKAVERSRGNELIESLVKAAMQGQVKFDKSVTKTINQAIDALDAKMSKQLAAIMHQPSFQKLEGSWRGLHYLVMNSETSARLKLRVLNVSKEALAKDLETAIEFDQSEIWKKVYESEFGMPGGEPYGALIGDYEFTNHPEDIGLLSRMSNVAAGAFCPFLSAASPKLFGFEEFTQLSKPRDLERIFLDVEYIKWNSFRNSEDSRFVTLTMPRVLSRLPYGSQTKTIEEFTYEEVELDSQNKSRPVPHEHYAWMNASYVLGTKLTDAFAQYGWCTAIRGAQNGGKVEGLPVHIFKSDDGDNDVKCPTEIAITDRREGELSKLGFFPLSHYKNKDYSVFFGAQSTQKPKKFDGPNGAEASANAELSARLPYIMAASRIAHYLKVIARDKIGSFLERDECETWLNGWITNYVCVDPKPDQTTKAKFPLAAARIEVSEVPGKPGEYSAVAHLRPWLQLEALNASLRLVASLKKK